MAFRLRCQTCREAFAFDPKTQDWPDKCPLCGTHVGFNDRPDDDVCMPSIRTARSVATDKVYRDIEAGSEKRMHAAAELAGTSVEDMSALKITNLKDNQREGDIAAPDVSQNLVNLGLRSLDDVFKPNGVEYSGAVQSGPEANSGARFRTALQTHHTNVSGGTAVSDRPALETTQPGYRRRG